MTSVLIASRNQTTAHGLKLLLENEHEFDVGVVDDSGASIEAALADRSAELLLIGPHYPGLDLQVMAEEIRVRHPEIRVAVLTSEHDQDQFQEAVDAGAQAYISVESPPSEFVDKIRMVIGGQVVVALPEANDLGDLVSDSDTRRTSEDGVYLDSLSPRQIQIIRLIGTGATNSEIGAQLNIAENTVKVHVRNIFRNLGLRNRQQAAVYALGNSLIERADVEVSINGVEGNGSSPV